jgi:hypothetical protein
MEATCTKEELKDALEDCLQALVSADGFISQKHGTINPARRAAIAKALKLLGLEIV